MVIFYIYSHIYKNKKLFKIKIIFIVKYMLLIFTHVTYIPILDFDVSLTSTFPVTKATRRSFSSSMALVDFSMRNIFRE
jgi:hypothetical protein